MFHHTYRFRRISPYKDPLLDIKLIGDVICDREHYILEHKHDSIEFCLVTEGQGSFFLEGRECKVQSGDLFLALPGQIHSAKVEPANPYRFFYLDFEAALDGPLGSIYSDILKTEKNLISDGFNMAHAFNIAINELMCSLPGKNLMLRSIFTEIILLLHRNYCLDFKRNQIRINSKSDLVQRVVSYINANTHKKFDLLEMSETIGYSGSYISRVFREQLGMTLSEYYIKIKMNKARYLIKSDKNVKISEVAEKLGFDSIHYFSRLYTKHFGVSPSRDTIDKR